MDSDKGNLTALTKSAYDAVKDLEAGDEYRLAGFKIVLKALLGGFQPMAKPQAQASNHEPGDGGPAADWQKAIAARMDIDADNVLDIYHLTDDNQLELVIEAKDLPRTNSKSIQHIAVLLSAGRQALGIEKTTAFDIIRSACERYKVYDAKNFSTYMGRLGSKFRLEGTSVNRSVELTNGAFKTASEIAKQYLETK